MSDDTQDMPLLQQARLWQDENWTAQVIKNEDDEGWAVAMVKDGEPEPALIGPWTMGRDKKNPKPLDTNAFNTLVKTAREVVRRHEQHLQATLHREIAITCQAGRITVALDIVPDDDDPHALLRATGERGNALAEVKVLAGFKLSRASATAWAEGGFGRLLTPASD